MVTDNVPHDDEVVGGSVDQRVFLHGVSWEQLEQVLALRGECSVPRIAYLRGELELMSPSTGHENIKKKLARMLEAYAEELGIELEGIGSWTLKGEVEEAGAEPDECYSVGPPGALPDIAIEVAWSRGGLDKLAIYRRLGVREVWFWRKGVIELHQLVDGQYRRIEQSVVLPAVDVALITSLLGRATQTEAVRSLRAELRRRAPDG